MIKQKRCGKIKGRTCADGSKQQKYLKEFETVASPTLSLDGLIGSILVCVYKGRDVATCNVPGAYLHPELPSGKRMFLCKRSDSTHYVSCKFRILKTCGISERKEDKLQARGGTRKEESRRESKIT